MKKILCFGDSNTYGYIPAVGERFDVNTRWTGRLKKMLMPDGYELIEGGVNGRTTVFDDDVSPDRNGSKMLGALLQENYPIDIAVVMLGTNDCKIKFGADAEMITQGLEVIVSQIKLFDSRTKILLMCPAFVEEGVKKGRFAENFDDESILKSKSLKEKYKELARKLDCGYFAVCDIVKCDASDGIHLNAESHRLLAEAVYDVLKNQMFADES